MLLEKIKAEIAPDVPGFSGPYAQHVGQSGQLASLDSVLKNYETLQEIWDEA